MSDLSGEISVKSIDDRSIKYCSCEVLSSIMKRTDDLSVLSITACNFPSIICQVPGRNIDRPSPLFSRKLGQTHPLWLKWTRRGHVRLARRQDEHQFWKLRENVIEKKGQGLEGETISMLVASSSVHPTHICTHTRARPHAGARRNLNIMPRTMMARGTTKTSLSDGFYDDLILLAGSSAAD